jgi:RHS repeat-associated protein
VFLVLALASLPARAQKPQPPVTPGDPRAVYIVVLNREKGAEPEFDKGGAKLLGRWSNRVVVELPPPALEAMLKHGRVKYAQHLVAGTASATGAGSSERRISAESVHALTGGGTLQWSTGDYQYDGSGNIAKVGPDSSGNTRRFVYDEVDRLVEAGLEAPMASPGTYTNYARYTYDSFGNRLTETTPAMAQTLIADKNTNRVTMTGTTITYDGVGNLTQGGGFYFTYDPFDNLKEVAAGGVSQKMAMYNAADERIIFCGDGSVGPCRWTLRGSGNEVLREYESGPIGNGNYWSYYLWVEDSVYRGSLLAGAQRETAEGGRLHFHLDHLGSPRLTTNGAGQKVTANEFAPFGRELTSITQEAQLGYDRTETHRFTGHERDFVEGTGSDNVNFIDYMHARTYLPTFGRFVSVDPGGYSIDNLQSWNRYTYTMNNPMNNTDPNGRETNPVTGQSYILDSQILVSKNNPRKGFFGLVRTNADGSPKKHGGNDIKAPKGTPVFAPVSGTVVQSGWAGGDGGFVLRIRRANDENGQPVYVHISHLNSAPSVQVGDKVVEGQPHVAEVGNTGNAKHEDPHAHTTVMVGGQKKDNQVDPQQWFHDHPSSTAQPQPQPPPDNKKDQCEPNKRC